MTLQAFLVQLCEHCGIAAEQVSVELAEQDDRIEVQLTVPEDESGRFIGYHGDALEAMQRVLRLAFEKDYPDKKIILNVNDYRQRRLAQLEEKVAKVAQQVVETGRPYTFANFMPSYERFAIHTALAAVPEADRLESFSHGEGLARRLTIALREESQDEAGGMADQAEQSEESSAEDEVVE